MLAAMHFKEEQSKELKKKGVGLLFALRPTNLPVFAEISTAMAQIVA